MDVSLTDYEIVIVKV